jgi:hypothetical protein
VTDGGRELGDERQMSLLAAQPWIRAPTESSHQRPVISENRETSSFQHETEMLDGGDHGEKLPVEGTVIDLGLVQLSREESQRPPPLPGLFLLYNRANVRRGGVSHQRELGAVDRML